MIELILPLPTPSLNRFYGAHWSRKAQERKKWGKLVYEAKLQLSWQTRLALQNSLCRLTTDPPVKLSIDRYGRRLCDRDNVIGGAKPLIDALVAEGFLVDDSPAHLQTTYRQHIGKPYRTVVTIT